MIARMMSRRTLRLLIASSTSAAALLIASSAGGGQNAAPATWRLVGVEIVNGAGEPVSADRLSRETAPSWDGKVTRTRWTLEDGQIGFESSQTKNGEVLWYRRYRFEFTAPNQLRAGEQVAIDIRASAEADRPPRYGMSVGVRARFAEVLDQGYVAVKPTGPRGTPARDAASKTYRLRPQDLRSAGAMLTPHLLKARAGGPLHLDIYVRTSSPDAPGFVRYVYEPSGGATDEPDCEARRGGDFAVPMCAEECTMKLWRWSFFATQYVVAKTATLGRHQGIGTFGFEYSYDPRFPWNHGRPQPWKNQQDKFRGKLADPGMREVDDAALCDFQQLHERLIYNHGRTLAKRADTIKRLASVELGPAEWARYRNPQSGFSRRVDAVGDCMAAITDGYCDSVCGNCSYVLPEDAIGTIDTENAIDEQAAQFPVPEGDPRQVVYYVGGRKADASPETARWGMSHYKDPYTHCRGPRSGEPTQALSSKKGWFGGNERRIIGRFGHNSNTDAEAEYTQFVSCESAPRTKPTVACGICGFRRDTVNHEPSQWPCLDGGNTAQRDWIRNTRGPSTSDPDLGRDPPERPPICRTSGKPVWGM